MSLTTDPNDPRLGRGVDREPTSQHEVYLVLTEEERVKGFVRPVRTKYVHIGNEIERDEQGRILGRLIKIDEEEFPLNEYYTKEKGYGGYIKYPSEKSPLVGKYITTQELEAITLRKTHYGGCGVQTVMGQAIAETYARNPKFYGSTYCVGCQKHLPVDEFYWDGTNEKVGS